MEFSSRRNKVFSDFQCLAYTVDLSQSGGGLMLKFKSLSTAIRIQTKTMVKNENAVEVETWTDLINEDIFCDWKNKYGVESYQAAALKAREPASIRLWYLPGITPVCRVKRLEDGAIFNIMNVDDVENRHQQLELEIQRYVKGG